MPLPGERSFGRHAADAMKWSGAAEVAGHLQDIVLGGTTSESVLLQGRSGCLRSERLYCLSAEGSLGTSQRGVFNRVRRRIPRDRLLHLRPGACQSGSLRSTTPSWMDAMWEVVRKRLA